MSITSQTQFSDLVYIDATGYHYADYPTILQWLQIQYQTIYGADVDLDSDTLDGQWIAVQAKALFDSAAVGASTYNSFSPVTAQGTGLSRVVKINGLQRRNPTNSTVELVLIGQSGTLIGSPTQPAIASDTLNQKWVIPPTSIPSGGTLTVTAVAFAQGAITAAPNTVTTIFTPTLGWQTVNNPSAATPGVPVETDAQLRQRQIVSVADPSLTVLEGTVGSVANLPGVTKVQPYENDTAFPDGNGIPAHSISIVVLGGDDFDIASEIALHKTPGCGTYGNTTELVDDSHGVPINISFERPTTATIGVVLAITTNSLWSSSYEDLIKENIASYISNLPMGKTVFFTRVVAPAYMQGVNDVIGSSYTIEGLELAKNGGSAALADVDLDWNENPFCDPAVNILVLIS